MTLHRHPARRLTVLVGEYDTYGHRPLATEIVHRAHSAGLAGASVFRGIEGFGTSHAIHTSRILSLSEDLPIMIIIVDAPEMIEDFLPQIAPLLAQSLIMVDDVEVVRFVRAGDDR
ncbi:MAG: DUF190 domain-containing protein [Pseudonocardiaceae bacterium]